jgi:hypothetical protein
MYVLRQIINIDRNYHPLLEHRILYSQVSIGFIHFTAQVSVLAVQAQPNYQILLSMSMTAKTSEIMIYPEWTAETAYGSRILFGFFCQVGFLIFLSMDVVSLASPVIFSNS